MSAGRLTPNFLVLWNPGAVRGIGLLETPWEIVGLYYDEDQAFDAFECFEPGARGVGQLAICQVHGLAYTEPVTIGVGDAAVESVQYVPATHLSSTGGR